jgi:uncharacterized protein YodC (DUF2158 family)
MAALKVGDVVKAKSGGPVMSVVEVKPESEGKQDVVCLWFKDNTPNTYTFPVQVLELYTR